MLLLDGDRRQARAADPQALIEEARRRARRRRIGWLILAVLAGGGTATVTLAIFGVSLTADAAGAVSVGGLPTRILGHAERGRAARGRRNGRSTSPMSPATNPRPSTRWTLPRCRWQREGRLLRRRRPSAGRRALEGLRSRILARRRALHCRRRTGARDWQQRRHQLHRRQRTCTACRPADRRWDRGARGAAWLDPFGRERIFIDLNRREPEWAALHCNTGATPASDLRRNAHHGPRCGHLGSPYRQA